MICCSFNPINLTTARLQFKNNLKIGEFCFDYTKLELLRDDSIRFTIKGDDESSQLNKIEFNKMSFDDEPKQYVLFIFKSSIYYATNVRLIYPDTVVTEDYSNERLNVYFSDTGEFQKYDLR